MATATEDCEMADAEATEEGNEGGGGEMDSGAGAAAAQRDDDAEEGSHAQQPFSLDARRRLKQEAYVTRGCGKNDVKTRTVDTFWETVWPALELLGWIKVRTYLKKNSMKHALNLYTVLPFFSSIPCLPYFIFVLFFIIAFHKIGTRNWGPNWVHEFYSLRCIAGNGNQGYRLL